MRSGEGDLVGAVKDGCIWLFLPDTPMTAPGTYAKRVAHEAFHLFCVNTRQRHEEADADAYAGRYELTHVFQMASIPDGIKGVMSDAYLADFRARRRAL